jgi:carbon storage regulator
MLVLTRRVDEAIVIRGDIVVTVLAVHGSQVRLGIQAPDTVQIDREEIRDRKLRRTALPPVIRNGA